MLLTKFKTTKAMIGKSMNPKAWYLESNDINQLFFFLGGGGGGGDLCHVCLSARLCVSAAVCMCII